MPHSITKYWLVNCKRSQREIRSPSQMRGTFVLKSARTIGRIETQAKQLQPNSSGTHSSVSNTATRLIAGDTLLDETPKSAVQLTPHRLLSKSMKVDPFYDLTFSSHYFEGQRLLIYVRLATPCVTLICRVQTQYEKKISVYEVFFWQINIHTDLKKNLFRYFYFGEFINNK